MSLPFSDVNWLAVLVAAVINMALGALWYSPVLFGNKWMELIGKTADEIEGDPTIYVFTLVRSLISALVLSLALIAFGAAGIADGLVIAVMLWLGFNAASTLVYTLFEGPPMPVWGIFVGYELVSILLQSILLTVWR